MTKIVTIIDNINVNNAYCLKSIGISPTGNVTSSSLSIFNVSFYLAAIIVINSAIIVINSTKDKIGTGCKNTTILP